MSISQAKAVEDVYGAKEMICGRYGASTSPELATEIFKMMSRLLKSDFDAGIKNRVIEDFANVRCGDDLYWALEELMGANSDNKNVARHALQAISYLAFCPQAQEELVGIGICRHVEEMMKNFGERNGDLAEWGMCAIQALTFTNESGRQSFSPDAAALLIRIFKAHVKTSSVHPGVAKMSLYAIANLSKEKNHRTQFNADGTPDLINTRMISNPLIVDEKVKSFAQTVIGKLGIDDPSIRRRHMRAVMEMLKRNSASEGQEEDEGRQIQQNNKRSRLDEEPNIEEAYGDLASLGGYLFDYWKRYTLSHKRD